MKLLPLSILIIFITIICSGQTIKDQNKKSDWLKDNLKGKVKSIKEVIHSTNKNTDEIVYTFYNSKGYKTEMISEIQSIRNKTKFKYSDEGNLIEVKDTTGLSTLIYSPKGNLDIIRTYDLSGKLIAVTSNKYDNKDNNIEMKLSDADGNLHIRIVYQYNDKNQVVAQQNYEKSNNIIYKFTHKYDNVGNIKETLEYNPSGSLHNKYVCEYVYDKVVNWTQKKEYILDKLNATSNRIYEYID